MYPTKKLSEICDIQNGYAFDANLFSEATGFPIIRIRDLKNSTIQTLYKGEIKDNFIVKKGDYLIGMDGEFRCYEWNNSDALLNQRVCRIINYHQAISPKFLFYGINKYLREIEDVTPFVTVKHISSKQIKDIGFPLPPLSTQSKIVAKLDGAFDNIDRQINLLKANIEDVESVRKSALGEIFHTPEMEVFNKKMGDFIEFTGGSQPPKDEFVYEETEGYVRLIQIRDYKSDNYKVYVSKNSVTKFCTKDDIMVGRYGPPIFQILRGIDGAYNVALMKAKFDKDNISPDYLYWFLNNPKIQEYIISLSQRAAGQTGVNKTALEAYPIPLPPLPRQHEIVEHLDRVFAQTAELRSSYEAQIRDLEMLRQSLLEEAFSGRLVCE